MKKLLFLFLLFGSLNGFSQSKQQINQEDYTNHRIEMADQLRAEGKIYVVVAIVLVILISLLGYTFLLDKKISRLEKELHEKKHHLA
jgi:CcmD family protein